jgi:RHS repeat-associated protein
MDFRRNSSLLPGQILGIGTALPPIVSPQAFMLGRMTQALGMGTQEAVLARRLFRRSQVESRFFCVPIPPAEQAIGATVSSETIQEVHVDHLDTPRALSGSAMNAVWRGARSGFGATVTNEDPDGDLTNVSFAIRLPGQFMDPESTLHYNRFRYFSAGIGRYVSADRIGQGGGVNTYGYSRNSPLQQFDALGLYCTYSQSSGAMHCYPASPASLEGPPQSNPCCEYYSETGYAGTNSGDPFNNQSVPGRNNPNADDLEEVGPIPKGTWVAGVPYNSPRTGPNTIPLYPVTLPPGEDPCFGTPRKCDTFRIHGAKPWGSDKSIGCIILPANRTAIPPGEIIFVVP